MQVCRLGGVRFHGMVEEALIARDTVSQSKLGSQAEEPVARQARSSLPGCLSYVSQAYIALSSR